jgi:hypothetical protein
MSGSEFSVGEEILITGMAFRGATLEGLPGQIELPRPTEKSKPQYHVPVEHPWIKP